MSNEQDLYFKEADENLQAAMLLMGNGYREISVSRSYYAMFYAATALLLTKEIICHKHSSVNHMLSKEFVKPGLLEPEFYSYFVEAQKIRETGDYELSLEISIEDATEQLENARKFVDRCRLCIEQIEEGAPHTGQETLEI